MEQQDLIIIVLGIVGSIGLIALMYINRTRQGELAELVGLISPLVDALRTQADIKLAPYGAPLKPLHDVATAVGSLVDEPDDWLVRQMKSEAAVAAIQEIVRGVLQLTDGMPPQESVPLGEPREGTDGQ